MPINAGLIALGVAGWALLSGAFRGGEGADSGEPGENPSIAITKPNPLPATINKGDRIDYTALAFTGTGINASSTIQWFLSLGTSAPVLVHTGPTFVFTGGSTPDGAPLNVRVQALTFDNQTKLTAEVNHDFAVIQPAQAAPSAPFILIEPAAPQVIQLGQTLRFLGLSHVDGNNITGLIEWFLTAPGSNPLKVGDGQEYTFNPSTVGNYVLEAQVVGPLSGLRSSTTNTISVINVPVPTTIQITQSPTQAIVGETLTFRATASGPSGNISNRIDWFLQLGPGLPVTRVLENNAEFQVTINSVTVAQVFAAVDDPLGLSPVNTPFVTINVVAAPTPDPIPEPDPPPVLDPPVVTIISAPVSGIVGERMSFRAQATGLNGTDISKWINWWVKLGPDFPDNLVLQLNANLSLTVNFPTTIIVTAGVKDFQTNLSAGSLPLAIVVLTAEEAEDEGPL